MAPVDPSRPAATLELRQEPPEASADVRQREDKDPVSRSVNREGDPSNLGNEVDVAPNLPVIVGSPLQTRSTNRPPLLQPDMQSSDTSFWKPFVSGRDTPPDFDSAVRQIAQQPANAIDASVPVAGEPVDWSNHTVDAPPQPLMIQSETTELLPRSTDAVSEKRPDLPQVAVDVSPTAVVPETPDPETRHNAQIIPTVDFEMNPQEPGRITQVAASQPRIDANGPSPFLTTQPPAVTSSNTLIGQPQIAVFLGIVTILGTGLIVFVTLYYSKHASPVLPSVIRLEIKAGDTSALLGLLTTSAHHDGTHAAPETHSETVVVEVGETDLPAGLGLQQTFADREQEAADTLRQRNAEICKSLFEQNLKLQQALTGA